MLHRFSRSSRDYRIVVNSHDLREGVEVVLRSQTEALAFLRNAARSFGAARSFRRLLAGARPGYEVAKLADDQVLSHVATLVAQRHVRIYEEQHRVVAPPEDLEVALELPVGEEPIKGFGFVADAEVEGPPLFDSKFEAEPPPLFEFLFTYEPPPREENDADAIDVAAQAETMRDAAKSGVPFCAECERLKKQKAAQAQATP